MLAMRTQKQDIYLVSLVLVFVLVLSTEARAELYGFVPISNNSGVSGAMAAQLSVDVTDPGGGQVLFTFYNDGPSSSIYDVSSPEDGAITGVYIEDGTLFELAEIYDFDYNPTEYPEVDFEQPAEPSNLPGWDLVDPDFQATSEFSVESEGPQPIMNAVSPGESLGLLYTLENGNTFADVLAAISVGFNPDLYYDYIGESWLEPSLRIGLFVQNLGEGGEFSDSFAMPLPASVILGILGLGVAGWKLRKYA